MAGAKKTQSRKTQPRKTKVRKNTLKKESSEDEAENQPRRLFDLPNEVICNVIEKLVEGQKWKGSTLSKLRQTCKQALYLVDPYWCKFIRIDDVSQYEALELVFQTKKARCDFVENLDITPRDHIRSASDQQGLLSYISRFPKMKDLRIHFEQFSNLMPTQWIGYLEYEFYAGTFSELRQCHLDLSNGRSHRLPLGDLLLAPKLTSLRLRGVNLCHSEEWSIDDRSTSLTSLSLIQCSINEWSLSRMLSKPRTLTALFFAAVTLENSQPIPSTEEEARSIQLMLRVLARVQPEVKKLIICFREAMLLEWDDRKGFFDFCQLESLTELSLVGQASENATLSWKPKNAFDKLPSSLEHMIIEGLNGGFDLDGLATDILNRGHNTGGLPQPPRKLSIFVDADHHRPFTETDQALEDKLKSGIHRLMTEWTLDALDYTQDHFHYSQNPPSYPDCVRLVVARRQVTTEAPGRSMTKSEGYDLEDAPGVRRKFQEVGRYPV